MPFVIIAKIATFASMIAVKCGMDKVLDQDYQPVIRPSWRDRFTAFLVRRINALADKRQARAARKKERRNRLRVISETSRCRGCGFHGKENIFGQIIENSMSLEFTRIQPNGQDPSTAAIKLTCLRCGAYSYEPTVQPANEWVVPLPEKRNPLVR